MRAWLYAMLVAATLVAAPSFAGDPVNRARGDWADDLFGTGGDAEMVVKTETVDSPKTETPALKGDKGDKGDTGATGAAGAPGKDGKNGATRIVRQTVIVKLQAPVQPAPVNGHIGTPGHGEVYREVENWHPASTSRVDLRDAQLRSRISGETEERQKADSAIRRQMMAQKNKRRSRMELIGGFLAGLLIAGLIFLAMRGGNGGGAARCRPVTDRVAFTGANYTGLATIHTPDRLLKSAGGMFLEDEEGNRVTMLPTVTLQDNDFYQSFNELVESGHPGHLGSTVCHRGSVGQTVVAKPREKKEKKIGHSRYDERMNRLDRLVRERTAAQSSPVTFNVIGGTAVADAATAATAKEQAARADSPTPAPSNQVSPDDVPKD